MFKKEIYCSMVKRFLLGLFVFGIGMSFVQAQTKRELNQEVKVVKAYKPVISDAKRISALPNIVDTSHFTPTFSYQVHTRPLFEQFSPLAIQAARLVGEPLIPLYGSRLRLAGGNYATLLGDFWYGSLRSDKYDFGVHLSHFSRNGKVTLENGDKEKMDWSLQRAEMKGKIFLKEGQVTGKVFVLRNGIRYYGYPNKELPLTEESKSITLKQHYLEAGVNLGYLTDFCDEGRMNYSVNADFIHFTDDFEVRENLLLIGGNVVKRSMNTFWGLDGNLTIYNTKGLSYWDEKGKLQDHRNSGVVRLNPYFLWQSGRWNLRLGAKTYLAMGDDSQVKLYPDIDIEFNAVKNVLTLFARVDGELETNDYRDIVKENPYIYSGLNVKNTDRQYQFTGGVKGRFSSNVSYIISAGYSQVKNQYFFAQQPVFNPSLSSALLIGYVQNKFGVVYDDINLLELASDLHLKWNKELSFDASAKFYQYDMDKQKKPWHMPGFEMSVDANYLWNEQWRFNAAIKLMDKRYVIRGGSVNALDGVCQLNLGADYEINDNFNAFVHLNNILADKYYPWDGYPEQGFNALLGLSVKF